MVSLYLSSVGDPTAYLVQHVGQSNVGIPWGRLAMMPVFLFQSLAVEQTPHMRGLRQRSDERQIQVNQIGNERDARKRRENWRPQMAERGFEIYSKVASQDGKMI